MILKMHFSIAYNARGLPGSNEIACGSFIAKIQLQAILYQNTMHVWGYHGAVAAPWKWNFVMKVGVPLQFHFYEKKNLVSKISTFI